MTRSEVERISVSSDRAVALQLDDADRPLLIEGGVRHLPAFARFSPAYLTAKVGAAKIAWKSSLTHKHPDFNAGSLREIFAREEGSLASLVAHVTTDRAEERARRLFTGDERFLARRRDGQTRVDAELAPLLEDLALDSLVPPDRLYTAWAWLSGPGVRTWLHYDNNGCHNLNAQLTGEKECELIDPAELRRLYPFVLGGGNPATNCSRVDVEAVDAMRFPEFERAPRYVAELHAGDLLFIPAWWWHTFRHVGDFNTNANVWWKPARSIINRTAERQALLDFAARAGLLSPRGLGDGTAADILRQLDEVAIGP